MLWVSCNSIKFATHLCEVIWNKITETEITWHWSLLRYRILPWADIIVFCRQNVGNLYKQNVQLRFFLWKYLNSKIFPGILMLNQQCFKDDIKRKSNDDTDDGNPSKQKRTYTRNLEDKAVLNLEYVTSSYINSNGHLSYQLLVTSGVSQNNLNLQHIKYVLIGNYSNYNDWTSTMFCTFHVSSAIMASRIFSVQKTKSWKQVNVRVPSHDGRVVTKSDQ